MKRKKIPWSHLEDSTLLEIVIRNIRTGKTQKEAFHEVGIEVGRSEEACGFRWNNVVRKQNKERVDMALAERTMLRDEGSVPLKLQNNFDFNHSATKDYNGVIDRIDYVLSEMNVRKEYFEKMKVLQKKLTKWKQLLGAERELYQEISDLVYDLNSSQLSDFNLVGLTAAPIGNVHHIIQEVMKKFDLSMTNERSGQVS
ncbi:hypothetical protein [Brevibacillus reuszeri]|uniref:hypothetical protein n=1 Tax=Brevibacillus reuszeri TaxID=54915 RepID=UPI003D1A38E4